METKKYFKMGGYPSARKNANKSTVKNSKIPIIRTDLLRLKIGWMLLLCY